MGGIQVSALVGVLDFTAKYEVITVPLPPYYCATTCDTSLLPPCAWVTCTTIRNHQGESSSQLNNFVELAEWETPVEERKASVLPYVPDSNIQVPVL